MDKATQRCKILAYCKKHGSITIREAFEKLHINSPSKRISELRLSGQYEVNAIEESRINDAGDTVRYKRYFIKAVAANG
jgi:predicted ArsR family transcriptional regulator